MENIEKGVEIGKLSLETLLCNINANQTIVVYNEDENLYSEGTEGVIAKVEPSWLSLEVTDIRVNDEGLIEITISNKF